MHGELTLRYAPALADIFQQASGQMRTFAIEHLPAHNFSAKKVNKQVYITGEEVGVVEIEGYGA